MKSRERILAAMKRQRVDRIPFVPNLNGYAIRGFAPRYHTMQRWELLRDLGIDLLVRNRVGARIRPPLMLLPPSPGPMTLASSQARGWSSSQPVSDKLTIDVRTEGDAQYVILDTPHGALRWGWRYTPGSPDLPFPIEHPVKTLRDIDVFHFVLDHTVVEPAYEEITACLEAVGDDGTCEAAGGPTPMQDLLEIHMGTENYYYFMSDHPSPMESLMTHLLEVRKEEYRILAAGPAPIVITGENTSTTLASPADIERVEFPALDAYSDIVHAAGKVHMAHMCGKLHHVVDALARTKLDGLHDVAPAPTGDLDFKADRQRLLAAGKCVAGGIDATAFVNPSPEAIEQYVIARLSEAAPGVGFLLSSGDTVPLGTGVETLRRIVRTLERYGTFPLGA